MWIGLLAFDIVYVDSFDFCYRPPKKKAKQLNANESAKRGKMDVSPKKLVLFHNCSLSEIWFLMFNC